MTHRLADLSVKRVVGTPHHGKERPIFTDCGAPMLGSGRLPVPFSHFDVATIGVFAVAVAFWVVLPEGLSTGFQQSATECIGWTQQSGHRVAILRRDDRPK